MSVMSIDYPIPLNCLPGENIRLSWLNVLLGAFYDPDFVSFVQSIVAQRQAILPPIGRIFSWTHHCRIEDVRVVIVGQDPYHQLGLAHGLAFSVENPFPLQQQNWVQQLEWLHRQLDSLAQQPPPTFPQNGNFDLNGLLQFLISLQPQLGQLPPQILQQNLEGLAEQPVVQQKLVWKHQLIWILHQVWYQQQNSPLETLPNQVAWVKSKLPPQQQQQQLVPVNPPTDSLKIIFEELAEDIPGVNYPGHGDLTGWARQGVLLLNTALTVKAGEPRSHVNRAWKKFTDAVIQTINFRCSHVVFMLWGNEAKEKRGLIDERRHLVLEATLPVNMHKAGFIGQRHFSTANGWLEDHGRGRINWNFLY